MSAYMKNKFTFLGIAKPERAVLSRPLIKQIKQAAEFDWDYITQLWNLPEREFQYLAVDCLLAMANRLQKDDIEKIADLITQKSWWDTVDNLAAITGILCSKYPALIESHILAWSAGTTIWLKRVAVLFQLKYREKTDTELLSRIICENSQTKEFFINKAIGWVLREYSKTDKAWVRVFIATHSLHPLSVREGSKYLSE